MEKVEGLNDDWPVDDDFLFEEPKRTDGKGNFYHDWLWYLTRHGYYCFICKKKMPDWKPDYCCHGADCTCQGYPIDPPVCSNECWFILNNAFRNFKHMWE